MVDGGCEQRRIVGKRLDQVQLRTQGEDGHPASCGMFLEVLQHLDAEIALVGQGSIEGVEHQHGDRILCLTRPFDPGEVGEHIGSGIGQIGFTRSGRGLGRGVFLKVGDGLWVAVLGEREILGVQAGEGAVILTRYHHVEHHDAGVRLE